MISILPWLPRNLVTYELNGFFLMAVTISLNIVFALPSVSLQTEKQSVLKQKPMSKTAKIG